MVVCLLFSLPTDPNAVKDAPRPTREDFTHSEPYLFHLTEDWLNQYPENFKKVFGLETLPQSDLNKVVLLYLFYND
jgi:hypothetical protein